MTAVPSDPDRASVAHPEDGPCFYLGTHEVQWLESPLFTGARPVPLFISHRRLALRKTLPRSRTPWALDSGGFSELSMFGGWRTTPAEYLAAVQRYEKRIGGMEWAAPQDWMCEPVMLAKTGLSIEEHQRRTVANFVQLREADPYMPFVPVLQGWVLADYQRCARMYGEAGVNLADEPLVGLGSVCRRQATSEIGELVSHFAEQGLRLHGFGVKARGLAEYGRLLTSADSMAWSYDARRSPALDGHTHKNCANCPEWALAWRTRMLARIAEPAPLQLPLTIAA
jgi:hypothetical protein